MFSRDFTDIKSGESFDTPCLTQNETYFPTLAVRMSADFELVVRFETM